MDAVREIPKARRWLPRSLFARPRFVCLWYPPDAAGIAPATHRGAPSTTRVPPKHKTEEPSPPRRLPQPCLSFRLSLLASAS